MKRNANKRWLISAILLVLSGLHNFGRAQLDLVLGPGYGVSYTFGKYQAMQANYESYLRDIEQKNPNISYEADKTFATTSIVDYLSFRVGASFDGGYFGFSFIPNTHAQIRNVQFANGYGRRFVFSERRYEYIFDLGFGSRKFDFFGSFGVNMNKFRVASYTLYPDGSASLTNEYYYNGVYKYFDAGLSYGLGFHIKPIQYLGFEFRYLFAHHSFPGENTDLVAQEEGFSDFSYAKTVGTDAYPEDYTQGFSGDNKLKPQFSQHYLSISVIFHLDADKLKKKKNEKK